MRKTILTLVAVMLLVPFGLAQRQVEVVAEVSRVNQTGTQGATLFTPSQTGVFRLTVMVQCTRGGNGNGITPILSWTDDNKGESTRFGQVPNQAAGPPYTFTFVFKAIAQTPINWVVQTDNSSDYEFYFVLEKLGPRVP